MEPGSWSSCVPSPACPAPTSTWAPGLAAQPGGAGGGQCWRAAVQLRFQSCVVPTPGQQRAMGAEEAGKGKRPFQALTLQQPKDWPQARTTAGHQHPPPPLGRRNRSHSPVSRHCFVMVTTNTPEPRPEAASTFARPAKTGRPLGHPEWESEGVLYRAHGDPCTPACSDSTGKRLLPSSPVTGEGTSTS